MSRQLDYSGGFDRANYLREFSEINSKQDRRLKQLYIPIWNDKFFFGEKLNGYYAIVDVPDELIEEAKQAFLIGVTETYKIMCIDVSNLDLSVLQTYIGEKEVSCFRPFIDKISQEETSFLAFAKGLTYWHNMNAYCGVCGAKTKSMQFGHSRECSSTDCSTIIFPRIDPAVIVLIEHKSADGKPMCLLNLRKEKSGYRCSVFSGFVEIGESLENAAIREMKEEIDVDIKEIKYVASQPWPFPSALMIGLTAKAETKDFKVDNIEIKEAGWYSAGEIQDMVNRNKLTLPGSDSITRYLIDRWVGENSMF